MPRHRRCAEGPAPRRTTGTPRTGRTRTGRRHPTGRIRGRRVAAREAVRRRRVAARGAMGRRRVAARRAGRRRWEGVRHSPARRLPSTAQVASCTHRIPCPCPLPLSERPTGWSDPCSWPSDAVRRPGHLAGSALFVTSGQAVEITRISRPDAGTTLGTELWTTVGCCGAPAVIGSVLGRDLEAHRHCHFGVEVHRELVEADVLGDLALDQLAIDVDADLCLLYTSPSPRDYAASRMPSSA